MTGVDPLRLRVVRRRVAMVKAFIGLGEPDDDDRKRHAAELGLSVSQFSALVRAWREHGRAVAISGAGAVKGTPRPAGARNLPAASKAAAREVIATIGPETSLVEVVRLVRERCAARRVATPSRSTIWNMVMAERRTRGGDGRDGVVVSRCHVKLPVRVKRDVEFPEVALAVDRRTGAVLAAAMQGDPETAASIALGVERGSTRAPILVDAGIAASVRPLTSAPIEAVEATAARTDTAKVLGRGFGRLDLVYHRSRSIRPAGMLRSRMDEALRPEDARMVVAEQLAAHNAARGAEPPILAWAA